MTQGMRIVCSALCTHVLSHDNIVQVGQYSRWGRERPADHQVHSPTSDSDKMHVHRQIVHKDSLLVSDSSSEGSKIASTPLMLVWTDFHVKYTKASSSGKAKLHVHRQVVCKAKHLVTVLTGDCSGWCGLAKLTARCARGPPVCLKTGPADPSSSVSSPLQHTAAPKPESRKLPSKVYLYF